MSASVKSLTFAEGVIVTAPTQNLIQASRIFRYATEADFVTAKGSPASNDDIFFNTTKNYIEIFTGGAWYPLREFSKYLNFATESDFVTWKGSSAVDGDTFFDTTVNKLKIYYSGWQIIGSSGGSFVGISTVTTNTTMVVNNAYICDSASLLDMKLPATCAVGDILRIIGKGVGKFKVVSNASATTQRINRSAVYSNTSSSNVIDLAQATNQYSVIDLECTIANQQWTVVNDIDSSVIGDTNWWGTGADGNATIAVNTDLTSTLDGDMVVKNYNDLTISTGATLSVSNRCRGLILYVKGNLVVSGTISMTAKGCKANPADTTITANTPVLPSDGNAVPVTGAIVRRKKAGQTSTNTDSNLFYGFGNDAKNSEANQSVLLSNGQVWTIQRTGGTGGTGATTVGGQVFGNNGGSGTGMSGGGASGGVRNLGGGQADSGSGGNGTCFSGGSASGGALSVGAVVASTSASNYAGVGTNAVQSGSVGTGQTGGGAGNNGGSGANGGNAGENGTGGTLIIFVRGNITINGTGSILARGKNGGGGTIAGGGGGGASGGGNILILHGGTLSNSGTISASGGTGGTISGSSSDGGNGGAGSVQGPTQIDI
jgi:hypothetical protein